MQEWTIIFKALSNENRLRILAELSRKPELPVGEIAKRIDLGPKATSKHLIILASLGYLRSRGKQGSVWYRLNPAMPADVRRATKLFL